MLLVFAISGDSTVNVLSSGRSCVLANLEDRFLLSSWPDVVVINSRNRVTDLQRTKSDNELSYPLSCASVSMSPKNMQACSLVEASVTISLALLVVHLVLICP